MALVKRKLIHGIHIFRSGMALRQKHMERLFDDEATPDNYEGIIEYTPNKSIRGSNINANKVLEIDYDMLKQHAPSVMDRMLRKPDQKISAKFLDGLSDEEFRAAVFSGAVIVGTNGNIFDRTARKNMTDLYKKCLKCCEIKDLDEFYTKNDSADGLQYYCKDCSYEQLKKIEE